MDSSKREVEPEDNQRDDESKRPRLDEEDENGSDSEQVSEAEEAEAEEEVEQVAVTFEADANKLAALAEIYEDIDGYKISKDERTRLRSEGVFNGSLTYGEVDMAAFALLLAQALPKPGEVFFDIGSGTGKALLVAAAFFDFHVVTGIEILGELHIAAQKAVDKFQIEPKLANKVDVQLIQKDCFDCDWSQADVLFAPCTCFDDEMMALLLERVLRLKIGTRIITTTRSLSDNKLKLLHKDRYKYAKGALQAFVYVRQ